MGLLPEFFLILGIDIFLGMSLLTALLDNDFPPSLQYLFQGAGVLGLGLLFLSQGFISTGIFTPDSTDTTRFWISLVYLVSALLNVIGLNVYLGIVRRVALATAFSGAVTVPTVVTSLFFIASFIDARDITINPFAISILAISVAITSLSIFGFLRKAARDNTLAPTLGDTTVPTPSPPSPGIVESSAAQTPSLSSITLDFLLPSQQREEWEQSGSSDEEER